MNWSKDALVSKAKVFFEKAFSEEKDSPFFGVFCALGLELLARASLANISPALLADSANAQGNILYALGKKDSSFKPKSLIVSSVLLVCKEVIPDFNEDCYKLAMSLMERRNEELHTGGGAFAEYNQDKWIGGFYLCCKVLSASMGETLVTIFGKDESEIAEALIVQDAEKVKKEVMDRINARRKVFEETVQESVDEGAAIIAKGTIMIDLLTHQGYHKVSCPCCGNDALIHGKEPDYGKEAIEEEEVVVKKNIIPNSFKCDVCNLRLSSYAELKAAGLPLHYTTTERYDPVEYFGIDKSTLAEEWYYEGYSND